MKVEKFVEHYTGIMSARSTIVHPRLPFDTIKKLVGFDKTDLLTKLNINIITATK